MSELKIVDFICDSNDRFSETAKIIKNFKWSSCRDVSKVWAFINVCVYYRIWVMNFVIIVSLIYRFLKNEEFFVWAEEQKDVMNILKLILTIASTLKFLNYSLLVDEIILTVNFSLKKWDVILFQINSQTSKNHSSYYESGLWIMFELTDNVIKREYRELLKALKKVRFWLYEVRFTIEIDVNILIAQFNRSVADFSEVLMICWLTWICLFDFNVRHVFDKRHIMADELFRRLRELSNDIDEIHEKNIDDFIDDQLNCVRICSMRINENDDEQFLKNEYFEKSQKIAHYLITLARFSHLNRKKFRKFKNWVLQFLIRDRHLFKQVNKNVLLQKVINKTENQVIILKQLYDENEHRGRKEIYRRVINKY